MQKVAGLREEAGGVFEEEVCNEAFTPPPFPRPRAEATENLATWCKIDSHGTPWQSNRSETSWRELLKLSTGLEAAIISSVHLQVKTDVTRHFAEKV